MVNWFQKQWASYTTWHILLMPVSWLFGAIVNLRRYLYKIGLLKSDRLGVPVIVVGNINVGGTGKTPLVIWLVEQLKLAGYHPGVISRGYGGNVRQVAEVLPDSSPREVGDEPVLIAARTRCPVFVSANRIAAGERLLASYSSCNVIVSDDGLQYYRMQRDIEIAVYDGAIGFGNGELLPAGPLREPLSRLDTVDALVRNGPVSMVSLKEHDAFEMRLDASGFYNLIDMQKKSQPQDFSQQRILAIAGIGNPQRFFNQLSSMGLQFEKRAFSDHYQYQAEDFEHIDADVVLMTEKDAVKCRDFARPDFWVLPVNAVIKDGLMTVILNKLKSK